LELFYLACWKDSHFYKVYNFRWHLNSLNIAAIIARLLKML
jgi:hypothetical protein